MSIVRIGLGENKKFGDGYEAIFGKKKEEKQEKEGEKNKRKETGKKPAKKK